MVCALLLGSGVIEIAMPILADAQTVPPITVTAPTIDPSEVIGRIPMPPPPPPVPLGTGEAAAGEMVAGVGAQIISPVTAAAPNNDPSEAIGRIPMPPPPVPLGTGEAAAGEAAMVAEPPVVDAEMAVVVDAPLSSSPSTATQSTAVLPQSLSVDRVPDSAEAVVGAVSAAPVTPQPPASAVNDAVGIAPPPAPAARFEAAAVSAQSEAARRLLEAVIPQSEAARQLLAAMDARVAASIRGQPIADGEQGITQSIAQAIAAVVAPAVSDAVDEAPVTPAPVTPAPVTPAPEAPAPPAPPLPPTVSNAVVVAPPPPPATRFEAAAVTPQSEAARRSPAAAPARALVAVQSPAAAPVRALVADAEPSAADNAQAIATAALSAPDDPLAAALTLLSQGFIVAGLNELAGANLTPPADPALVSAVAPYAVDDQRLSLAIRLYQKNIGTGEPFNREALLMLIDLEIERGEFDRAERYARQALQLNYTPRPLALLTLADRAVQAKRYGEADRLLDLFAANFSQPELRDEYLWIQGQRLEQDETRRDIKTAVLHYEQIVDLYPLSAHWEPARRRAQYLRRHFIDLR